MPMPRRRAAFGEFDLDLLAVEEDLAAVGPHDAGEDLHQRRLAGAVLADDGVDRAALDLEAHVGDRHDAAVALGEMADRNQRRVVVHLQSGAAKRPPLPFRCRSEASYSPSAETGAGALARNSGVSVFVHAL